MCFTVEQVFHNLCYNTAMLIDDIQLRVKAGNGGNGKVSFRRNGQTAKGGPDGGNGGLGGNVYFQGVDDITALRVFRFKKSWQAENGIDGGKQNLYGRKGKDLVLNVPVGTHIKNLENEKTIEIQKKDQKVLIAKGGVGGRGNNEFKSATNQTPRFAEDGELGEEKNLHLELRMIADIGLIGLPNAGKSSLLSVLTNAHPKIGNYAFTTLEPNLGVMNVNNKKLVLADIPGLIEGASKGRGLGMSFLKHIEKTKILVHCLDSTSKSIIEDYNIVREEFSEYSDILVKKKEILLLTKTDLMDKKELNEKIKELTILKRDLYTVSIYDESSVSELLSTLSSL